MFLERHYTVKELADAWHMSHVTVRSWFRGEKGVIRYGPAKIKGKGNKQTHVQLRVPESVARRVYKERTGTVT